MKPYQQSERQVSRMPQVARRDRMVALFSVLAIVAAVCLCVGESGETAAPVTVASK
jgi:hypothetical protein